eukprot:COSAG01_NODE_1597_length_9775_cov_6.997210_8_plen_102_part_00
MHGASIDVRTRAAAEVEAAAAQQRLETLEVIGAECRGGGGSRFFGGGARVTEYVVKVVVRARGPGATHARPQCFSLLPSRPRQRRAARRGGAGRWVEFLVR